MADTKSFVSTVKGALAGCCFPKSDSDMSTGDALDLEPSSSGCESQVLGETGKGQTNAQTWHLAAVLLKSLQMCNSLIDVLLVSIGDEWVVVGTSSASD